ncbi:WxL domain-containing protein [Lactococcus muris]|uniref:WxL domain-containing protein n=1 Tax=Lactococcus muris TaxID=2941330 RepID=A0ABV4D933_9LACT
MLVTLLKSTILVLLTLSINTTVPPAVATTLPGAGSTTNTAKIIFEKDDLIVGPVDPDNPYQPIIPEQPGQPTGGLLSIDFVSNLYFGQGSIDRIDRTYYARPMLATISKKNGKEAQQEFFPNFVQITDRRPDVEGWMLSVRQDMQFRWVGASPDVTGEAEGRPGDFLAGARLTFSHGRTTTGHNRPDETVPNYAGGVSTILVPGVLSAPVLSANTGQGKGTWHYAVGNPLPPEITEDMLDEIEEGGGDFSKFIEAGYYDNYRMDKGQAPRFGPITLHVPRITAQRSAVYQSLFTWTLSDVPRN